MKPPQAAHHLGSPAVDYVMRHIKLRTSHQGPIFKRYSMMILLKE